jgi:hypothetical protein
VGSSRGARRVAPHTNAPWAVGCVNAFLCRGHRRDPFQLHPRWRTGAAIARSRILLPVGKDRESFSSHLNRGARVRRECHAEHCGRIRRDCLHPPGSVLANRRDFPLDAGRQHACEPHGVLQRKPATRSVHRSVERDPRLSGSMPRHRAMRDHDGERPTSGRRVVPRFDGSAARPRRRRHRHLPFPRQRCSMDPRGKKARASLRSRPSRTHANSSLSSRSPSCALRRVRRIARHSPWTRRGLTSFRSLPAPRRRTPSHHSHACYCFAPLARLLTTRRSPAEAFGEIDAPKRGTRSATWRQQR